MQMLVIGYARGSPQGGGAEKRTPFRFSELSTARFLLHQHWQAWSLAGEKEQLNVTDGKLRISPGGGAGGRAVPGQVVGQHQHAASTGRCAEGEPSLYGGLR